MRLFLYSNTAPEFIDTITPPAENNKFTRFFYYKKHYLASLSFDLFLIPYYNKLF